MAAPSATKTPEYLALTTYQLAKVLRGFRKVRGLTQENAAARGGLLQKTVSKLETAPEKATLDSFFRLLVALDVEIVLRDKPAALSRNGNTEKMPVMGRRRRSSAVGSG